MKTQKYVLVRKLISKLTFHRSRAFPSYSFQEMLEVISRLDVLPPRRLNFMLAVFNRIRER